MAKFVVYSDSAGEFRFRLKAGNGQTILSSEGYKTRANCMSGIESVKKNSQDDSNFERLYSSIGKPRFNLKAGNGEVIGISQMYTSDKSMENGIAAVRKNARGADTVYE